MSIAKSTIVATDFSGLGHAATERGLALAMDSELRVVHVLSSLGGYGSPLHMRDEIETAERRARAGLEVLAALLGPRGRRGQALLLLGEPAAMILTAATNLEADLIVLGAHGHRRGRLSMGGTAQKVVNLSSVPVLVVKRGDERWQTKQVAQQA